MHRIKMQRIFYVKKNHEIQVRQKTVFNSIKMFRLNPLGPDAKRKLKKTYPNHGLASSVLGPSPERPKGMGAAAFTSALRHQYPSQK